MHRFAKDLITEWRRLGLPVSGETIVVGVSGGADSMSLLAALDELQRSGKLKLRLHAAHFDHRLRGDGGSADERFVREFCAERGIGSTSGAAIGRFALHRGGNLEENARVARYRFLGSVAESEMAFAVVTAHTLDDQAETFLINLLRGGGRAGLSGMPAVTENFVTGPAAGGFRLVRPLLNRTRRSDTEKYCADFGIAFRTDPMNSDPGFTRVRVRQQLIPLLATFNPKAVESIARAARLIAAPPGPADPSFDSDPRIADLARLEQPERFERIRGWLALKRGHLRGIGLKQIEAVDSLALSRKSGREAELPGGARVIKRAGGLIFRAAEDAAARSRGDRRRRR
jgi:tRNA(Ile)-lysidine synthetase-like protein